MKLGQIMSYMEVPLPDSVQDTLAKLQTGHHGMPEAETRAVIESTLGDSLEALFDSFDVKPIAAASIGQVHRARFAGRDVAVKVQYPDVAQSFTEDLGAIGRIASLASLASAVDGTAIVEELGARLQEECDYQREAVMQRSFARAFADDPAVRVPDVVGARSARTVLTSEWIDGDSFETIRRTADPARRTAIARTLVRFSIRSMLGLATIQADPHPGNFLFTTGDEVAFLDFGCVRHLDRDLVVALRQMATALRDDDRASAREAAIAMGLVGNPRKFDHDHFFVTMEAMHRPLLRRRFRFEPRFMRDAMALNGPTSPNARTMAFPPAYLWVSRLQWGLWAILTKLGVEGSFDDILDEVLSHPITPMPTVAGDELVPTDAPLPARGA